MEKEHRRSLTRKVKSQNDVSKVSLYEILKKKKNLKKKGKEDIVALRYLILVVLIPNSSTHSLTTHIYNSFTPVHSENCN